ncbi:MAG TPA: LLM class flavin-dependent oxidoreductase, partial [Acidimicrobiia bacterium]|nr:LLM class flavin-dependent oxidoreductase [Acidimicrobiia bacterium]
RWPDKKTRDARLLECVAVIRALLAGAEVTHRGLVTVDRARLWSLPEEPPRLFGAAVSEATARTVGSWADGLITINQPSDQLRRVLDAFREGGGEGKPAFLQVHLSWAESEGEALAIAHDQWRSNVFSSDLAWNLEFPEQFDAAAAHVRPEDVRPAVLISADTARHAADLRALADLGFDGLYLHHVGQEQDRFIDTFAAKVLADLR